MRMFHGPRCQADYKLIRNELLDGEPKVRQLAGAGQRLIENLFPWPTEHAIITP